MRISAFGVACLALVSCGENLQASELEEGQREKRKLNIITEGCGEIQGSSTLVSEEDLSNAKDQGSQTPPSSVVPTGLTSSEKKADTDKNLNTQEECVVSSRVVCMFPEGSDSSEDEIDWDEMFGDILEEDMKKVNKKPKPYFMMTKDDTLPDDSEFVFDPDIQLHVRKLPKHKKAPDTRPSVPVEFRS